MKKWILGIGYLWVAMTVCTGEQLFRTFTAKDGRSIEARIVEYDARKGRVKILPRGAAVVWVAPGIFSELDQVFIKEWIAAASLVSEAILHVEICERKSEKSGLKNTATPGYLMETETRYFEIKLQNRSKSELKNIEIEYRYYVKRTGSRTDGSLNIPHSGWLKVKDLGPMRGTVVTTKTQRVETEFKETYVRRLGNSSGGSYQIAKKKFEEEFQGVWIRIYGSKIEGVRPFRDITFPHDLRQKVKWYSVKKP